jgi:plastocyanin
MRALRHPRLALVLATGALVLVTAACGSDDGGSTAPPPENPDLVIVAPGGLKWEKDAYTASAGDLEVLFRNDDAQSHSLLFKDADGDQVGPRLLLGPGQASGETVSLAAGTYEVYCDIPGHAAAGMVSELTVS